MQKRRSIVLFLFIALVILNADQMVMSPIIGSIEKEFGITDSHIGQIGAAFTIVGAIISLIWGYLSDRYNRKKLLIASILVGEIPCLMTALSANYLQFFFWRILTGVGIGASFPISYSLIGDLFDHKERGKVSAVLGLSATVGGILGMLIAGYTANIFGWRIPFILVSAPNLLLIPFIIYYLEEPKRAAKEEGFEKLSNFEYVPDVRLSDYIKLFKIKTNLLLLAQGIAGTIPWGAIPFFMIEFFRREINMSLEEATTVFLLFAIGAIVGNIIGGYVGEKLYKIKKGLVPLSSAIATIIGVFFTVLVFRKATIYIPGSLSSLIYIGGLGFFAAALDSYTGPNMKMMLLNVNEPKDRGRVFSIFNLTDSLGTGIGRYVGGVLSVSLGTLAFALEATAFFWLICGFILMFTTWFFEVETDKLNQKMREIAEVSEVKNEDKGS